MGRAAKFAAFLVALCTEAPALAATITVIPNYSRPVVAIDGELRLGDEDTFAERVLRLKDAVVMFNSLGGNLIAGIEIGRAIRLKGFDTFVPDGMVCASACGLAWLGGRTLLAGPSARIGFHAAWVMERGEKREKGPGNALVGAYLYSLGLKDEAIVYLTLASPDDAMWLNFKDAYELGIQVKEVPSLQEQPKQIARKPEGPSSAPEKPAVPDAVYLDADVSSEPNSAPPAPTNSPSGVKTAAIPLQQSNPQLWRGPEPPDLEPQVLNLVNLDAAAQVQRRLQERGFFNGIADGVWGPKSRIALRDFKSANGLGTGDEWDLRVQLALFDDRYRTASASYVPPDPLTTTDGLFRPFSPIPGTSLHPLNPSDALKIQTRLFELGYYRKAGDGVWGMASRNALRDFKTANGLPVDDVWDSNVQDLFMSGHALPALETPFGDWAVAGTSCTDLSNPRRLSVSAKDISAGSVVCRVENGLIRTGDTWKGAAMCPGDGREVPIRVMFRIAQGRLIDQSTVASTPRRDPYVPIFERCRQP